MIKQALLKRGFQIVEAVCSLHDKLIEPLPNPGDILILTASSPEIGEYANISEKNKSLYAGRHGYAFLNMTSGFDTGRPPAWSKIRFILKALETHRWVFWSDADSLIMNGQFKIESLINKGTDILLTEALTPFRHINTGQMLFQSTLFSRIFLKAVWSLDMFTHHETWEQQAINHLFSRYHFRRARLVPNRIFNSFGQVPNDPDPYQPGDFIIHFPGCPNKTALIRQYAALANP